MRIINAAIIIISSSIIIIIYISSPIIVYAGVFLSFFILGVDPQMCTFQHTNIFMLLVIHKRYAKSYY